jgi:hypothetical protein
LRNEVFAFCFFLFLQAADLLLVDKQEKGQIMSANAAAQG